MLELNLIQDLNYRNRAVSIFLVEGDVREDLEKKHI